MRSHNLRLKLDLAAGGSGRLRLRNATCKPVRAVFLFLSTSLAIIFSSFEGRSCAKPSSFEFSRFETEPFGLSDPSGQNRTQ